MSMKEYEEDEYLMLSGIQHFAFCRRQWALIHIEQQWAENFLTIDGDIFHEITHDEEFTEVRNGTIITRGLKISSRRLGISGNCDVVEFHPKKGGIQLDKREGTFCPVPIEYKRGKPKEDEIDELQLTAQAMCLEEMLLCHIPEGFLYYGEPRRRTKVVFHDELRNTVELYLSEMHSLFTKGYTPKVKKTKKCTSCSLANICVPKLNGNLSTKNYIERHLKGEECL